MTRVTKARAERTPEECVIGAPLNLVPRTTAKTFHTPFLAQAAADQLNALFAEYGIVSVRAQPLPYSELSKRERKHSPSAVEGVWKVVVRSSLEHFDAALLFDAIT